MLIMSKSTGIIYENICLERHGEYGNPVDTQDLSEIDFKDYNFGYTRLCDTCADIANKVSGFEGTWCFNINCQHKEDDFIGEVIFTEEEIASDLVVYETTSDESIASYPKGIVAWVKSLSLIF